MKLFANAQYLTLGELSSELQFDLMKNANFANMTVKIRLPW